MVEAAERAISLVGELTIEELENDRLRHEALLWSFTVLGEAAAAVSAELKAEHPEIPWRNPVRLRNRVVHGYWSIDFTILHHRERSARSPRDTAEEAARRAMTGGRRGARSHGEGPGNLCHIGAVAQLVRAADS
ncbi:MAG: HepT-like ribonuclease domain-containing protein [Pseudonocardia sp.]